MTGGRCGERSCVNDSARAGMDDAIGVRAGMRVDTDHMLEFLSDENHENLQDDCGQRLPARGSRRITSVMSHTGQVDKLLIKTSARRDRLRFARGHVIFKTPL